MTVGFTSVVGDLFHAGHIAMIQECRLYCDYLIVCVMADTHDRQNKETPTQSLFERFYQAKNCCGIDELYACDSENDLLLAMQVLAPRIDVRFVGEDYKGKDFTGVEFCKKAGIQIIYNKRSHGLSSTELKKRIRQNG